MSMLTGFIAPRGRALQHIAIDTDLQVLAERGGSRTGYCLATDHARLCLLPWSPVLAKRDHWQQFALGRFAQAQGLAVDNWIVRVIDEPPPRARLAVAVPMTLLSRLNAGAGVGEVRIELLERLSTLLTARPDFDGSVLEVGVQGATLVGLHRGALIRLHQRSIERPGRPTAERAAGVARSLVPTVLAEQASGDLQAHPLFVVAPKLEFQSLLAQALRAEGIAAEGWPC